MHDHSAGNGGLCRCCGELLAQHVWSTAVLDVACNRVLRLCITAEETHVVCISQQHWQQQKSVVVVLRGGCLTYSLCLPCRCSSSALPQLEGSVKSAQTLFARYDMDLDLRLKQQDYYDLMLELALALPYQEYQRFIDASFAYAGEHGAVEMGASLTAPPA